MANVIDVAAYILEKVEITTTWKLQKLVYYSQVWHAVWEDEQLFLERIEAWANGPVCRTLYDHHRGEFRVSKGAISAGNPENLAVEERESIDKVVDFYNRYSGQQLSDLTHAELPWRKAREGVPVGERSRNEISVASMTEYYSSL